MDATIDMLSEEDLAHYAASLQRMLEKRSSVQQLRDLRDSDTERSYDPTLWTEIVGLGVLPDFKDTDPLPLNLWTQTFLELGRTLALTPLLDTFLATRICSQLGLVVEPQIADPVSQGKACLALVGFEGECGVVAEANADGWILRGNVSGVLHAQEASGFLVHAAIQGRPGDRGIFLVGKRANVETSNVKRRLDSGTNATLSFKDAAVPANAACAETSAATIVIEDCRQLANILLAWQLQGVAETAWSQTLEWLKTREQFGVKIGSFQALQHRAARAYLELEKLKALNASTQVQLTEDPGLLATRAAACKFLACRVSRHITGEAIQLHGGIGMTDECDIGFFFKAATLLGARFGGRDAQLQRWQSLR